MALQDDAGCCPVGRNDTYRVSRTDAISIEFSKSHIPSGKNKQTHNMMFHNTIRSLRTTLRFYRYLATLEATWKTIRWDCPYRIMEHRIAFLPTSLLSSARVKRIFEKAYKRVGTYQERVLKVGQFSCGEGHDDGGAGQREDDEDNRARMVGHLLRVPANNGEQDDYGSALKNDRRRVHTGRQARDLCVCSFKKNKMKQPPPRTTARNIRNLTAKMKKQKVRAVCPKKAAFNYLSSLHKSHWLAPSSSYLSYTICPRNVTMVRESSFLVNKHHHTH